MKRKFFVWTFFLLLTIILSACIPFTFSPPVEIHWALPLDPTDHMEEAVIAVDGNGRSHIAGVIHDRIVYYRTRYGETIAKFPMAMSGSGPNWKQYSPDIAALNDGTAYVTWVEQRGGPEKFACWRSVPLVPPVGGYEDTCVAMDTTIQTSGNVWVVSNGYSAYAVYDRMYLPNGRVGALMYKELTNTATTGLVYDYISYFETGYIYGLDMVIDTADKLHIAIMDNFTVTGSPPYTDRLHYRSNREAQADGTMTQAWTIATGTSLGEDVDPSISIYTDLEDGPRIGIASIWTATGIDDIYIDSCNLVGCEYKGTTTVALPSSWNTYSQMEDLEIQGRGELIFVGFIGDDNTAPTGAPQVYFTQALDTTFFYDPSDGSATFKNDLEMVLLDPRPGSPSTAPIPVISWAESDLVTTAYFSAGWMTLPVKISEDDCVESTASGNIGSNGIYFSGVWDACGNTWFTTQTWNAQLPLIVK